MFNKLRLVQAEKANMQHALGIQINFVLHYRYERITLTVMMMVIMRSTNQTYLDRRVVGSFMTITSVISPNLLK